MQKVIRGKEYNTETARLLGQYAQGAWGDPAGFEERLYETPEGFLFFYANGGSESPYAKETLKAMSRERGDAWLAEKAEA